MFLQSTILLQQTMHAHCRWPSPVCSSNVAAKSLQISQSAKAVWLRFKPVDPSLPQRANTTSLWARWRTLATRGKSTVYHGLPRVVHGLPTGFQTRVFLKHNFFWLELPLVCGNLRFFSAKLQNAAKSLTAGKSAAPSPSYSVPWEIGIGSTPDQSEIGGLSGGLGFNVVRHRDVRAV